MRLKPENDQLVLPMGALFLEELKAHPVAAVAEMAERLDATSTLEAVQYVMDTACMPAFLHSALCAMSLPIRRPKDEFAPIVRHEGNYSLVIKPSERMKWVNGELVPVKIGAPFGVFARLVMLFIMTEAVKQQTREIYLGKSFSEWLRRMGIKNTKSGGRRGTRSLVQDQVERLMSCEWTFRWDQKIPVADEGRRSGGRPKKKEVAVSAFAATDMRLVNQYGGVSTEDGEFVSRFVLSEPFYENLIHHAVPMNERAVAALRTSATQIDLYTFLTYRLPRIKPGEVVRLNWEQLASHLGNEKGMPLFKFRQTVRKAWEVVSGVYQQASRAVDLSDQVIKLTYAPPPLEGHIRLLSSGELEVGSVSDAALRHARASLPSAAKAETIASQVGEGVLRFPKSGSVRYGYPELKAIALEHAKDKPLEDVSEAFRRLVGAALPELTGDALVRRFIGFCKSYR
jgi:hypothetical protein